MPSPWALVWVFSMISAQRRGFNKTQLFCEKQMEYFGYIYIPLKRILFKFYA